MKFHRWLKSGRRNKSFKENLYPQNLTLDNYACGSKGLKRKPIIAEDIIGNILYVWGKKPDG